MSISHLLLYSTQLFQIIFLSDKDRLYYLAKHTSGKANDLVKRFLAMKSENSYREARKLLD